MCVLAVSLVTRILERARGAEQHVYAKDAVREITVRMGRR